MWTRPFDPEDLMRRVESLEQTVLDQAQHIEELDDELGAVLDALSAEQEVTPLLPRQPH